MAKADRKRKIASKETTSNPKELEDGTMIASWPPRQAAQRLRNDADSLNMVWIWKIHISDAWAQRS